MNKNKIARLIGIVLAIVLFFGCLFSVKNVSQVEPPAVKTEETQTLQAETLSTGRGSSSDSDEETDEADNESESDDGEESKDTDNDDTEESEESDQEESKEESAEESSEESTETEAEDSSEESASENTAPSEESGNSGDDGNADTGDKKGSSSGDGGDASDKSGDTTGGNAGDDKGDEPTDGPSIITDLDQYTENPVTPSQLTNDTLSFMAKATGGSNLSLEVRYRHASDKGNGKRLYVSGTDSYQSQLKFGHNYFTLILRQDGKKLKSVTYDVEYRQTADENNPSSGTYPPEITMISPEESRWPFTTSNRNFEFKLSVKDIQTQKSLTKDNISVTVTDSHGNELLVNVHGQSYELYLERPNVGDVNVYTVKVTAWDEDGCSASFKSYTLTYNAVDSGNVIGKATVVLDATTVGMGVLDIFSDVEIKQDENIAEVVSNLLTENGYVVDHGGSTGVGFYLRGLESGSINTGTVPSHLWEMIQRDNVGLTDQGSSDRLSEFNYTRGSGWMYSINGSVYEDKGMSERYLQDGDTLYIRFTLAWGKDIGGYGSTGETQGVFSSYCYQYVDGEEIFMGHGEMKEVERVEATESTDGYIIRECERCGEQEREEIPRLEPTDTPEPTPIPTEEPTAMPTEEPTPEPTEEPTPMPTEEPTPTEIPDSTEGANGVEESDTASQNEGTGGKKSLLETALIPEATAGQSRKE